MKFLALASLVALVAANPAWDAEWEPVKVTTTTKPAPKETWVEVPSKKMDDDWEEWHKKPVYTTTVVTAITTYCPEATTVVHAGKTYAVTKGQTLTVTDCPCTISVPVYVKTSTSCPAAAATTWASAPVSPASSWAPAPVAPSSTVAASWSPVKGVATYTGAANKLNVGAGFGAIVGAAALLL